MLIMKMGCFKVAPGQFIELFYGGENKPESVRDAIGVDHLCFEVEDINETAELLKSKGVIPRC